MSNNTRLITGPLCSFTMSLLICSDNKSSCKIKGNIEQKPTLILYKYVWLIWMPLLWLFRNVTIVTRAEDRSTLTLTVFVHPLSSNQLVNFCSMGEMKDRLFCPLIIFVALVKHITCETNFKFMMKNQEFYSKLNSSSPLRNATGLLPRLGFS